MVIGGTEAGKTTFLNSYLNYLLGVQLTDKFRYKIINEVNEDIKHFNNIRFKSRTTKVTAYNIRRKNGKPIIMIDTPHQALFIIMEDIIDMKILTVIS